MRSRDTLVRLKKFQVDEKRRQVVQLEAMLQDFGRMVQELDNQIKYEEQKAGIHDQAHYAYPTFARAALQRKENISNSINDMNAQLDRAREDLNDAIEELKKVEILNARDQEAAAAENRRRDQATMDEVALSRSF